MRYDLGLTPKFHNIRHLFILLMVELTAWRVLGVESGGAVCCSCFLGLVYVNF